MYEIAIAVNPCDANGNVLKDVIGQINFNEKAKWSFWLYPKDVIGYDMTLGIKTLTRITDMIADLNERFPDGKVDLSLLRQ